MAEIDQIDECTDENYISNSSPTNPFPKDNVKNYNYQATDSALRGGREINGFRGGGETS